MRVTKTDGSMVIQTNRQTDVHGKEKAITGGGGALDRTEQTDPRFRQQVEVTIMMKGMQLNGTDGGARMDVPCFSSPLALMSSGMPPLSLPPMPSTSSMITRRFFVVPSALMDWHNTTSATCKKEEGVERMRWVEG